MKICKIRKYILTTITGLSLLVGSVAMAASQPEWMGQAYLKGWQQSWLSLPQDKGYPYWEPWKWDAQFTKTGFPEIKRGEYISYPDFFEMKGSDDILYRYSNRNIGSQEYAVVGRGFVSGVHVKNPEKSINVLLNVDGSEMMDYVKQTFDSNKDFQVYSINGIPLQKLVKENQSATSNRLEYLVTGRRDVSYSKGVNMVPLPEEGKRKVELFLNNPVGTNYTSDSVDPFYLPVAPISENGRTLVPLRKSIDFLGADVRWVAFTKKVIVGANGKEVKVKIGSNKAYVDGQEFTLDVAPKIVNGTTLIPLRFISENVGYNVHWDGSKDKWAIPRILISN